jgi:hypothetical protein
MYHYKARIYSPTLGRFLQVDPTGYDDDINLYAYVRNDPTNGRDPDGLSCTPNPGGRGYSCKIDNPGNLRLRTLDRLNRAYTRAVNRLMYNPNRRGGLVARDRRGSSVSRRTTAGEIAETLIAAKVTFGGDAPLRPDGSQCCAATTYGSVASPEGYRITIWTPGARMESSVFATTMIHEGAHATRSGAALLRAAQGWETPEDRARFDVTHQVPFNALAKRLYEEYNR